MSCMVSACGNAAAEVPQSGAHRDADNADDWVVLRIGTCTQCAKRVDTDATQRSSDTPWTVLAPA